MKNQPRIKYGAMLALAAIALIVFPRPTAAGNWVVNSVPDLIVAINAANQAGGANTIVLAGGRTYTLTAVDNTASGPNGLPAIAAGNDLTIVGNGATIARSARAKAFRLLYVAPGGSLTLEHLTLTGGLAKADSAAGCGGAIYNDHGALTLNAVTVTGNSAVGSGYVYGEYWDPTGNNPDRGRWRWGAVSGLAGVGGGIYSYFGELTLTGGTLISNNSAVGFNNGTGEAGGVYVAGGNATLTDVTLSSNTAVGGDSGKAGTAGSPALGGGLYIDSRCGATLTGVTLSANVARGGAGKFQGGEGRGGALCVYGYGPPATLTNVTLSGNAALGGNGGSWGGEARGGGLAVYCYAVTLTDAALSSNRAVGGDAQAGGYGGGAYGGAVHFMGNTFDAFTLTLRGDSLTGNAAEGGTAGAQNGAAQGGGIFDNNTWNTAHLDIDAFTLTQTVENQPDNIYIVPPPP